MRRRIQLLTGGSSGSAIERYQQRWTQHQGRHYCASGRYHRRRPASAAAATVRRHLHHRTNLHRCNSSNSTHYRPLSAVVGGSQQQQRHHQYVAWSQQRRPASSQPASRQDRGDDDTAGVRGSTTTTSNSNKPTGQQQQQRQRIVDTVERCTDFFGEPVTFWMRQQQQNRNNTNSGILPQNLLDQIMASYDGWLLAVVSKGQTCVGGGDEAGLSQQPIHSVAIAWSDIIRYASVWNHSGSHESNKSTTIIQSAPMLAVVAVAPVLVQTGVAYVRHLDTLLSKVKPSAPGLPTISLIEMCEAAIEVAGAKSNGDTDDEQQHVDIALSQRERIHCEALRCLLRDDHVAAMTYYLRLLQSCPGDAFTLSLVMDLAHQQQDKLTALRAASTVSSYWNERRGGWFIRPSLPGHAMATSMIALGYAVGGRHAVAEQMIDRVMQTGTTHKTKWCGGWGTWCQAILYDARGGVAEGISACANNDGKLNYETCGWLFFHCRLAGYGARFSLDREERGRGRSAALRLYEEYVDRVLRYSGFANKSQQWDQPMVARAPLPWKDSMNEQLGAGDDDSGSAGGRSRGNTTSWFGGWLGGADRGDRDTDDTEPKKKKKKNTTLDYEDYELLVTEEYSPSTKLGRFDPNLEDVLTWIPPTPSLLTDATLLLLRFTFNGTIGPQNARWDDVRNAWQTLLEIQQQHHAADADTDAQDSKSTTSKGLLRFYPQASIVASILFSPTQTGGDLVGNGRLARGLHRLGALLNVGVNPPASNNGDEDDDTTKTTTTTAIREIVAERDPSFWLPINDRDPALAKQWKEVVDDLASAIDGADVAIANDGRAAAEEVIGHNKYNDNANNNNTHTVIKKVDLSDRYEGWDFDTRPLLEHAVCYAACKSGDSGSLWLARSICSQGVTLRPNSPEEWWRYSIVLGLLGDEVGSEDAWQNSINFGAGQGAQRS